MEKIENRFIRYVKIDTEADENSSSYPSSAKQLDLAKLLHQELLDLGLESELNEWGLVYAKLPGDNSLPKIGLIAHMDTAPTIRGGNFEPRIINNYDGKDIKLNDVYTLSPTQFPHLTELINKSLIVTDGDHLLGGDDKAGVAIIMSIVEYFVKNPQINHAPIRVCFTPDEEIGLGALHFNVEKMDADIAYTLDGGNYKEVNYENFNAASAEINIKGVGIHPGSAKDIMVNALLLGMEFNNMLDSNAIPGKTENYEGFYHLCDMKGDVENCDMYYILRDHDKDKLEQKENRMNEVKDILQTKYPTSEITLTIKHQYKNMRYYFDNNSFALDYLKKAYSLSNVEIEFAPIRGGTDGATITYMGLPCPNIGTGDYCCHGRYEHVVIEEMYQMFDIVKNLLTLKQ